MKGQWVVVVAEASFPRKVYGPFENEDVAAACARGLMQYAGQGGGQAVAIQVTTP